MTCDRRLISGIHHELYTLRLHYNVVVGVLGKTRYNGPRYMHTTVVQNL